MAFPSSYENSRTISFPAAVKTAILAFVFLLSGPAAGAGGHGLPVLIALAVVLYAPFWVFLKKPLNIKGSIGRISWPIIFFLSFLAWVSFSFLWSPYKETKTLWLSWISFFVSVFFLKMIWGVSADAHRKVSLAFLISLTCLAVFFLVEISFNFPLTQRLKGGSVPYLIDRIFLKASMIFTVLAGPALALSWSFKGKWRLWGLGLVLVAGVSAFMLPMAANSLSFFLGALGFGAALLWPKHMPSFLLIIIALALIVFPFIMLVVPPSFWDSFQEKLPYSWAQRVEVWQYIASHIMEHPFSGWGLKASRACEDTVLLRGEILKAIPTHPHNASMQIWYETGMTGISLLALSLLSLAGKMIKCKLTPLTSASISAIIIALSVPGFLSFDIWHEWWWGTAVFAIAACSLVALREHGPDIYRNQNQVSAVHSPSG